MIKAKLLTGDPIIIVGNMLGKFFEFVDRNGILSVCHSDDVAYKHSNRAYNLSSNFPVVHATSNLEAWKRIKKAALAKRRRYVVKTHAGTKMFATLKDACKYAESNWSIDGGQIFVRTRHQSFHLVKQNTILKFNSIYVSRKTVKRLLSKLNLYCES